MDAYAREQGLADPDESTVFYSQRDYPERLRRIRYRDSEGRPYVFLTNHMTLPAMTICDLYRLPMERSTLLQLQILSVSPFENVPLYELLTEKAR